jgi:signal transduction histidine kinase/ligand-binding sensor domain-containing protein
MQFAGFKCSIRYFSLLKTFVAAVFLLLYTTAYSFGQQKQLQFRYLTSDNGLSSSTVLSILQDYKGFLWIGTYEGVNRYDGASFINYKKKIGDSTSLVENHVRCIFQDSRRNLFLGTYGGLSKYDRDKDRFYNYMAEPKSPLHGMNCSVSSIDEDHSGNLWMATSIGLIFFDPKHSKVKLFTHIPDNDSSLSHSELEQVVVDSHERIWVTSKRGLNLMLPGSKKFYHMNKDLSHNENLDDIFFLSIAEDKSGNLWFGSVQGLFMLDAETDPVKGGMVHYKNIPGDANSISNDRVKSLFVDSENNVWAGTENGGLNLFDSQNNTFWQYRIDPYNPNSINNESIQAIYEDCTGNLWIGTFMGGINIAINNGEAIRHYRILPGAPYSLSHNVVTCFLEDHNGKVWVGTDGGGVNLFEQDKGWFRHYNTSNSTIGSDAILCIMEDSRGRIWIGTWAGGLNCFDPESQSFRSYNKINSGIPDNNIYSICEGKDNELWLGSFESGLIHFQVDKGRFTNYITTNSNIYYNMINVIRKDSSGNLYLGTVRGLQVFNTEDYQFSPVFTFVDSDPTSLSNVTITDILIINDTSVWVATPEGLNLFNPQKGKFRRFYKEDGLPSNIIRGLELDDKGLLWVSTSFGLSRFDYLKKNIRSFTKADGLQSNEFYDRSHCRLKSGALLFGGINGFNLILPDLLKNNPYPPNVVITGLYIFNKPLQIGARGSPLKKAIDQTRQIILNYDQSVLTFYYSALDFTMPEKNQYMYKMDNFDKNWINAGNKREATYTNLSPGTYIFRVIASNNDNIWNETGTSLEIIILPPWWQTWWFRVLAGLTFIGLLIGFYFIRLRTLREQKEQLQQKVIERTREIEEKNAELYRQTEELNETNTLLEEKQQRIEEQTEELKAQAEELSVNNESLTTLNATKDKFFSIIAHDLKNPFNSILGFCEVLILRYSKYDDTKRLHLIGVINQSAQQIYKLLENLLQWARSQTGSLKFEPEEFSISELILNNSVFIENMLAEKHILLETHVLEGCRVFADRNMINTVLRNLLTNAIKFTEAGTIRVEVEEKNGLCKVSVEDTGIGMPADKAQKLFEIGHSKSTEGTRGETGTGLGLIICKDFIEKNGGNISVESELGKGSTFYFTLQLHKMN